MLVYIFFSFLTHLSAGKTSFVRYRHFFQPYITAVVKNFGHINMNGVFSSYNTKNINISVSLLFATTK